MSSTARASSSSAAKRERLDSPGTPMPTQAATPTAAERGLVEGGISNIFVIYCVYICALLTVTCIYYNMHK